MLGVGQKGAIKQLYKDNIINCQFHGYANNISKTIWSTIAGKPFFSFFAMV